MMKGKYGEIKKSDEATLAKVFQLVDILVCFRARSSNRPFCVPEHSS